jgi:SAM-dependent methyltransferase
MKPQAKDTIITGYREAFLKYGDGPEATMNSAEGQRFRFAKISEIADLRNRRVLDIGSGLGDLYPFLLDQFSHVDYTGVDLVPEMVAYAAKKHPSARFLCRDLLAQDIDETFDYVLVCGVFNNAIADSDDFMKQLLQLAFKHCTLGLGFNFLSSHVNFTDPEMSYHDPAQVLDFCIKNLTRKVVMHHHYERVDVAVFAYR